MPAEWEVCSLGDLINVKHGFAFQGSFIRDEPPGDFLLTPGNFAIGGGFKGDKFKYYDGPVPEAFVLGEGDLLVTMTDLSKQSDTLGFPAFVPKRRNSSRYLHNQRLGKVHIKDPCALDKKYLHYLLCSGKYREEILASATGTTVKHTSPERIHRFRFLRPPLDQQRAIAHILGTLDDKIELNRRMSETLESMTRALFKSWFVDFDPVRAKAEGRDANLAGHIADVFPDRLDDSPLGRIPAGWQIKTLSECVEVARGLSYQGPGLTPRGLPMHNLNSVFEGGGYKDAGLKHYAGEYKAHHVARAGDVIVANTEQGHDRLLIGYAAIVPDRFREDSLFSHHLYRVRPKDCGLTNNYLCHLLNTSVMHEVVSGYANGTTVNMLPAAALQAPLIVVPPECVIAAFEMVAEAIRLRREGIFEEYRTLADLRDTLLPPLMSGRLRVREASLNLERSTK